MALSSRVISLALIVAISASFIALYTYDTLIEGNQNQDDHYRDEFVSIDQSEPSISIDLGDIDAEYICLTSAEYNQLYLPQEYQCFDCDISDSGRDVMEKNWQPSSIILAYRVNNLFNVTEIDLSEITSRDLYTEYQSAAYNPDYYGERVQCIRDSTATAYCFDLTAGCLFLFDPERMEIDEDE